MKKFRLAILASGSGSNAEAIMKWAESSELATVVCLASNVSTAPVIKRAGKYQVPVIVHLKKNKLETRELFDQRLIEKLKHYKPDWIILAGYMRLLSREFLEHFNHQVINIHPSLLPAFPGTDGYGEAFSAGVEESGCTVHYVDEGMDTGSIIAQRSIPMIKNESLEEFKKRGLVIENSFYPEVIENLLKGKI